MALITRRLYYRGSRNSGFRGTNNDDEIFGYNVDDESLDL